MSIQPSFCFSFASLFFRFCVSVRARALTIVESREMKYCYWCFYEWDNPFDCWLNKWCECEQIHSVKWMNESVSKRARQFECVEKCLWAKERMSEYWLTGCLSFLFMINQPYHSLYLVRCAPRQKFMSENTNSSDDVIQTPCSQQQQQPNSTNNIDVVCRIADSTFTIRLRRRTFNKLFATVLRILNWTHWSSQREREKSFNSIGIVGKVGGSDLGQGISVICFERKVRYKWMINARNN